MAHTHDTCAQTQALGLACYEKVHAIGTPWRHTTPITRARTHNPMRPGDAAADGKLACAHASVWRACGGGHARCAAARGGEQRRAMPEAGGFLPSECLCMCVCVRARARMHEAGPIRGFVQIMHVPL